MIKEFIDSHEVEVEKIIMDTIGDSNRWIISPAYRLDLVTRALKKSGHYSEENDGLHVYLRGEVRYHTVAWETAWGIARNLISGKGIGHRTDFLKSLLDCFEEDLTGEEHDKVLRKKVRTFRETYNV